MSSLIQQSSLHRYGYVPGSGSGAIVRAMSKFEGLQLKATKSAYDGRLRIAGEQLKNPCGFIDVSWLEAASEAYQISNDPADYVITELPIVTADVPNRNLDAFGFDELTKFNPMIGRIAYQTFVGKPTHINHENKDPLKAKGVIFDASLLLINGQWHVKELAGFDRTKDRTLANDILSGRRDGYCLSGDTLISTSIGLIHIQDALKFLGYDVISPRVGEVFRVDKRIMVDTPNGQARVVRWMYSGKQKTFGITTKLGNTIEATGSHQFLELSEGDVRWTPVEELKPGSRIAVSFGCEEWPESLDLPQVDKSVYDSELHRGEPIECEMCHEEYSNLSAHIRQGHNTTPEEYTEKFDYHGPWMTVWQSARYPDEYKTPSKMTPELAELLGLLISEGGVGHVSDSRQIGFVNTEEWLVRKYDDLFEACFGTRNTITECRRQTLVTVNGYTYGPGAGQTKPYWKSYKYSEWISKFLELAAPETCEYSKDKGIPWSVLEGPRDSAIAFLRGLYLGDGSHTEINRSLREGDYPGGVVYFSSSEALLRGLQIL